MSTTLGDRLREAREAKGLSIAELSKKTHIMSKQLEGLEVNDFTRIPAPIYIKSFVKKFAQEVDLDPDEMVALYQQQAASTSEPPAPRQAAKSRKAKKKRQKRPKKKRDGLTPIGVEDDTPAPAGEASESVHWQAPPPQKTVTGPEPETPSAELEPVVEQGSLFDVDVEPVSEPEPVAAEEPEPDLFSTPEPAPPVAEATPEKPSRKAPKRPRAAAYEAAEGVVGDVGEVRTTKRARRPQARRSGPSMAAVVAAKVRGIKAKFAASREKRKGNPARKPWLKRPEVKQFFGLLFAVCALAALIFGILVLSDRLGSDQEGGVALGDLRTNPVIMDPPAPYLDHE